MRSRKRERGKMEETFFHKSLVNKKKIEETRVGGEKKEMEKKKRV